MAFIYIDDKLSGSDDIIYTYTILYRRTELGEAPRPRIRATGQRSSAPRSYDLPGHAGLSRDVLPLLEFRAAASAKLNLIPDGI